MAPMGMMGFITRPFDNEGKIMFNEVIAQAHMAQGHSSAGDLKGRVKDSDPQCEIHNQMDFLQSTLNELHNRMSALSERLVPIRAMVDEISGVPNIAPAKTQMGSRIQEQSSAVMNITRMVNDILSEIQI